MRYLIFLVLFNFGSINSSLDAIRNNFPNINSLEQAELGLKELEKNNDVTSKGYYAAMLFMKSKYVKFPFTKFKFFKKGKLQLDTIIKEHPANIEMRYIRFLLQSEMPSFLGYNKNLEEDYLVIIKGVGSYNLSNNFKNKILNNMLVSKNISDQKAQIIKQMLINL